MSNHKGMRSYICIVLAVPLLVLSLAAQVSANWLPETRLTAAFDASYLSYNNARCLVTDQAGVLHLVWYDFRDGDSEIYYNRFNGVTWGPETALTNNTTASEDPAAAVDSGNVLHVVWADLIGGSSRILHKSFDGVSWGPAEPVNDGSVVSENPSVAADGLGNIHAVWREYRDDSWGVFYSVFDGMAWAEDLKITDPTGYPGRASIACDDSDYVHVVWADYRDSNWEIYYRRFNGVAWEAEVRLTTDGGLSEHPTIVTDSLGSIHVFWDDDRNGQFDIYQKIFDGLEWSTDERLTAGSGDALAPSSTAGEDGVLHLTWYGTIGGSTEIYYMEFDGMTWTPGERISDTVKASENPMIALDVAGVPHIVWHDARGNNVQIYWRTRSTLPKPEITSIEPDSGFAYTVVNVTDLAGTDFFVQVKVWLQTEGEEDIQATNEAVESATRVSCDFDLWDVPTGQWDVVVENLDLQRDTLFAGFTVVPLPPLEITSIEPDTATAYEDIHITNLSGHEFFSGATVWLERVGEENIHATGVTVESLTRITCDFNLTGAKPGGWDVFVQNPDGYSGSLPGGFTVMPSLWSDDLRLTDDDAESSLSQSNARSIAVDSQGHLHVVWNDLRDGNREIYYKSFDGVAWSADQRLTVADNGSADPGIAVDESDNLHIVWSDYRNSDYEIYYKRFDGASWGPDARLTSASGDSRYPSIAVDGENRVYVVWQDKREGPGTQNIYFRMHDGSTWLPEQNIASDIPGSGTPAIAIDGNNHAHVAWYQEYVFDDMLYYKSFDGSSWGEAEILTDSHNVYGPTIATDSLNQVHVAWHDYRDDSYEIFYRRFDGLTWGPEERVTGEPGNSSKASIVVDNSGHVHMNWVDKRDGNNEIYYACRKESSWGPHTRLTKAPNESIHPSLALAPDGALHMVWRDLRDGNYEIYYKMRDAEALAAIGDRPHKEARIRKLRVVPNPLKISTQIQFNLTQKAEPGLSIYDVSGRLVRKIEAGLMGPGPQSITWDGKGNAGEPVAQGIYFLEVSTKIQTASAKIIILR